MPIKVLTDHKGFEYFMTTKKPTPRQAKWAEFLSKFNFIVTYQTGKRNDKTDTLTKKPNKQPANKKDEQQKHWMQVLLLPKRIKIQPIKVNNEFKSKHKVEPPAEPLAEPSTEPHAENEESVETKNLDWELTKLPTLPEQMKELNQSNALFTEVRKYLANLRKHNRPNVYLRGSQAKNGLLYKNNKLWVANDLRLDVI